MGFWERMNASPGKNYDALKRSQQQASETAKRQHRARAELKKDLEQVRADMADLKRQVASQAATIAEQGDGIDRLTRCLLNSNVIEPADLAAVLPRSVVQDTEW